MAICELCKKELTGQNYIEVRLHYSDPVLDNNPINVVYFCTKDAFEGMDLIREAIGEMSGAIVNLGDITLN